MSASETLRIAHTARCKLQIAADRPDRNFRFILGHALTLDKLLVRVAEISNSSDGDSDEDPFEDEDAAEEVEDKRAGDKERRVSFSGKGIISGWGGGAGMKAGRRSPPPPRRLPGHSGGGGEGDDDDDDGEDDIAVDDEEEEDEEEDEGLGLQRFPSASAQPPRKVVERPEEPLLSEEEVRGIVQHGGQGNGEWVENYRKVVRCRCHGHSEQAPSVERMWEVPGREGMAVVEVGG